VNDPALRPSEPWQRGRGAGLCGGRRDDVRDELEDLRGRLKSVAAGLDRGACPLRPCLQDLRRGVAKEAEALRARGRHVTVVVGTQGRPTNRFGEAGSEARREFTRELAAWSKLPVKIIVRLCTDTEEVRDMFNTLDKIGGSLDVLDDFWGEAREVYLYNPWLTYTMGLHRLRESGLAPEVMDDLDEEPLDLDAIHELCRLLFLGRDENCKRTLPHPRRDGWRDFFRALTALVEREKPRWNPIKKTRTPWINLAKLDAMHGRRQGARPRARRSPPPSGRGSEPSGSRSHRKTTAHGAPSSQPPGSHSHRRTAHGASSSQPPRQAQGQRRRSPDAEPGSHPPRQAQREPAPPTNLPEALKRWSHQPPKLEDYHSLPRLLVTVPNTFPPTNAHVEPHEYFAKWKAFDEEAFADESGDELKELLKRGT